MRNSNTLRRLMAAALAIVMAMALAIPAFAAEPENTDTGPNLKAIAAMYADWDGSYELPDLSELSPEDQEVVKAMVDAIMLAKEAENKAQATTNEDTDLTGDEVPAVTGFSDVPSSHTFYKGVMDCAKKGITNGYADGTFRPANPVTRAQFAVMLSRAFFPNEVKALQNQAEGKAWYWANLTALANKNLLANTELADSSRWSAKADSYISRYDMAQLMCNIMTYRGKTVTNAQKNEAQAKMTDWKSVPSKYQNAIRTVYALGIITGYADGTFSGTKNMNRGQGCIVIYRMMTYVPAASNPGNPVDDGNYDDGKEKPNTSNTGNTGNTGTTTPATTPETKPETAPETPKSTTIKVTTQAYGNNNGYVLTDNGWGTGYLNNGKPITEANVTALMNEAKKIWPNGMSWSDASSGTNVYNRYASCNSNSESGNVVQGKYNVSAISACGGFACMISDYLFGFHSNPMRQLDDKTEVRPGDIVILRNSAGATKHVCIAAGTVYYVNGFPCVNTHNGNTGGIIDWSDGTGPRRVDTNCVIYTRYPD